MIYCTVFNPAVDVIYSIKKTFEIGSTMVDIPAETYPAGKGINVARIISTLGEKVKVIGLIPRNDDDRFGEFLTKHGVDYSFFHVEGNARVNTTILEEERKQVTHLNAESEITENCEKAESEFLAYIYLQIKKGDTWILSGSLPPWFSDNAYKNVIQRCHDVGAKAVLDTRGVALHKGARAKSHVISPNINELEEFFDEPIDGVHHIALKGKRLFDLGIDFVFITLGADGMIAVHQDACLLCSAPELDSILDTVGCGDALLAGVIAGQQRELDFKEVCSLGIACGMANALHKGGGKITIEDVERFKKIVKIESV